MKKENLLEFIGGIEEDFIEEAAPKTFISKQRFPVRFLSVAACFLVAVGVGTGVLAWQNRPFPDLSGRYEEKYVAKDEKEMTSFVQVTGTTIDAYMSVSLGNHSYRRKGRIPDECISDVFTVSDILTSGAELELYRVKNISEDYALSMKVWDGTFDVLLSSTYLPETVGEWKNAMSPEKNAEITSVRYSFTDQNGERKTVEFENVDQSRIHTVLFGNERAKIKTFSDEPDSICITVKMDIPSLALKDYVICISTSGDVYAKMPERVGTYRIGKETVHGLITYLAENCEGKELIYLQN